MELGECNWLQFASHRLIPGGCHTYAKGDDQFPELAPAFIRRGLGCQVWDMEGNEFTEYGMGLRAVTLGHAYPAVLEAVKRQLERDTNFTRPSPLEVECAEKVLGVIEGAEQIKFTKDGSTANTAAVKLARASTARDLVAFCSDHPFFSYDDWFIGKTPMNAGIPRAISDLSLTFRYNDLDSVRRLFDEHPGEIACTFLEPARDQDPADGLLHKTLLSLRGVRVANGLMGLPPRSPLEYQRTEVQRVAGVAWVLPNWVIADARPAKGDPLPEFRLVSQVRASDDPGRELATIDVETTARCPRGRASLSGRPGSVQVGSQRNAERHVRTRADSSQLLVVAIHHHPGWKARIDGVPAKVIQVNGDFMGFVVPAGDHEVLLRWEPSSLQVGMGGHGAGAGTTGGEPFAACGGVAVASKWSSTRGARVNGQGAT